MATYGRYDGGRSKVGIRSDMPGLLFRSSWEANWARYLEYQRGLGSVTAWEFEPQVFRFPEQTGERSYLPDFKVWVAPDRYEWHEVKGRMDAPSRSKLARFAAHYPAEAERLLLVGSAVYKTVEAEYKDLVPHWE